MFKKPNQEHGRSPVAETSPDKKESGVYIQKVTTNDALKYMTAKMTALKAAQNKTIVHQNTIKLKRMQTAPKRKESCYSP